jgi:hypothetical protein
MEIRRIGDEPGQWYFLNVDPLWTNALRRTVTEQVPTIAIDAFVPHIVPPRVSPDVYAFRFSALAIQCEPSLLQPWFPDSTPTTMNVLRFYIDVQAPSDADTSAEELPVLARHVNWVPTSEQQREWIESHGGAPTMAFPDIVLAMLRPGERFCVSLEARVGVGSTHARFHPTNGTPFFKPLVHLDASAVVALDDIEDVVRSCPEGIFEQAGGSLRVNRSRAQQCTFCTRCESRGVVRSLVRDGFKMDMESKGVLRGGPARLLAESVEALDQQLVALASLFSSVSETER